MSSRKRTTPEPEAARSVLDTLPFDPTDAKLPRGLRLYGAQLARARTALAAATPPTTARGHAIYKADLRTPLFMLEGLSRVSLGTGGDKDLFEDVLREVKIVEDALGEVDYWWVVAQKAPGWKVGPAFQRWAEDRHRVACGRLVGWLEARAWVDHRYLPEEGKVALRVHRLGKDLLDADWPSPPKERKRLLEFLADKVRSTEETVKKLDLSQVEQGLHELRRRVRWISIYVSAVGGAVQLDAEAKPPKGWSAYLTDAVVQNPFNKLPPSDGTFAPITVPAPLFYALSWLIAELGAIKDRAQWTETVTHGLHELGAPGERPLGDLTLTPEEAGKMAEAVAKKTLFTDKLLTRLADALDAQRA